MRSVTPVVFYDITNVECVYSSITTIFIEENIKYFLHEVQLHISALDNGHLQVVHEILIKHLYKIPINIVVLDEYTHSTLVIDLPAGDSDHDSVTRG